MVDTLETLAPFAEGGRVQAIVESPRGARVKFEYVPEQRVFRIHRPLPVGLAYPFDWGFIPGTRAADGDPVDVLVMGDQQSYPGTLIEGEIIAVLHVRETGGRDPRGKDKTIDNPRIVAAPAWLDPEVCRGRLDECRRDIEAFLAQVGEAAGKQVLETRWSDADDARRYVESHRR